MDGYTILAGFLLFFLFFIYITWFGFSIKVENEKNEGSEIKMNPYFPIVTVPHMRGAVLAQKKGVLDKYNEKMFEAIWIKALNLNDQIILSEVATESGIDGNEFAEGIMSDEIKEGLKINTQYAVDNGAFGVPTFYFNDEMYWGIDSMKFLIEDLNK